MIVILMILSWITGASAALDPRYRCEHLLLHGQSVPRWFVDHSHLTAVQAEHSSVGYASLIERTSRSSRIVPRSSYHRSFGRPVIDETNRRIFEHTPNLSNGESIVLSDGRRIGIKDKSWMMLPPPHWMEDPKILAHDEELELFKIKYPHALDQLLVHPDIPADLDFATAQANLLIVRSAGRGLGQ